MNKSLLRGVFQKKRALLSNEAFDALNKRISDQILEIICQQAPKIVHIFLSVPNSREPNTHAILENIRMVAPNIRIVAPYMIPGTRLLEHYFLEPDSIFKTNPWGIPEPDPMLAQPVNVQDIDMVFLPLLAFDELGYRVGYGGGYYDRFLARCNTNTQKIGISLFPPVDKIEDLDQYDIRMDACITPDRKYYWV